MALNCYRCSPPEEPMVLVIERSPNHPLCEKCGNSMVNIVDRVAYPYEQWEADQAAEAAAEEIPAEEAPPEEVAEAAAAEAEDVEDEGAQDAGEVVEVMDPPPPPPE